MDSGLGSDEEQRRTRTKEQKQRLNEQLLSGANCFIDASSLQDEEQSLMTTYNDMEQRRTEERRQGALLFQSSIPQYSTMLQLAGPSSIPPETPYNSIVQINHDTFVESEPSEVDVATKPSLGFYVDLNDVEVESTASNSSTSATTKNIFSMVIDFEAPKKDMPSRLLRNASRKKLANKQEIEVKQVEQVESDTSSVVSSDNGNTPAVVIVENKEVEEEIEPPSVDETNDKNIENNFVRLSDLMPQKPRIESEICADLVGARMSRSIPESSWVESPLMMSRSAGFRIAPRPLEPDSSLSDSTGSQTAPSQRRLGTDLLRMFLEELDTDTVLYIGSPPRAIKAHRCILISRCQYFAGTLRGRSLAIDGFSYDAVHFALCHIYSGAAHVPDSISLVELASLADMLSLEGLKEVVGHALKSRHCHNFHSPCAGCLTGVLEVLPLSAAYGLDELYQRCLKWIKSNYLRVWPSRAFASLSKELREKCYQQHIVHMSAATVLTTSLSCDRLLASLPTLKWAEPVVQLTLQLSNNCQLYITQHYAAVLPSLLDMEPWNYPRLEEILLNSTNGLTIDQECLVYSKCRHMLDKYSEEINSTLKEMLEKLCSCFEKRLVQRGNKVAKCPQWMKMDAGFRMHIKKLGKFEDVQAKSTRNEPSRLPRMVSSKPTTSSSESSRNSSPATSQTHPSPSLRRSLLLAARAPQVPPSPSTARRISTLTMPTAASAAKSAPARHIKQTTTNVSTVNKTRPISAPVNSKRTSRVPVEAKVSSRRETTTTTVRNKTEKRASNQTPVKKANVQTERASKESSGSKNKSSNTNTNTVPKSPGMQRSSTFLKDEPTVLTYSSQNQIQ